MTDQSIQPQSGEQPQSDAPLKFTHYDLSNLVDACDYAISSWEANRRQWDEGGEDEFLNEEGDDVDATIAVYAKLKARIAAELKHCERCRKVAPLYIYDTRHTFCEECLEELEAKEAGSKATELTVHEMDDIVEVQCNLDASELDEAIDQLSREQLVVLRQDCLASVKRQTGILARIQSRLAQK